MNYQKIYDQLIYTRKNRILGKDMYYENHHIIPKCLGGNDDIDNIISLTAREHYLAHWLLYKIHKTKELVHAWHCMSRIGKGQESRSINSHLFEYCKIQRKKHLSEQYSGSGNNFYGRKHTEETRNSISKANSGKVYKTEDQIKQWIETVAKKPKSLSHREKIGRKGLMMLQNIHTLEIIRVSKTDERCTSNDWINPRKLNPESKYKCDYCDVVTTKSNLKRWHNEKCKRKNV